MNMLTVICRCTAILCENFSGARRHSSVMGSAFRGIAAVLASGLGLCGAPVAQAADFELTPAETRKVAAREIVIRANLDAGQRRGTVRAAVPIEAPPTVVFQLMSRCADAVQYVPHLRLCRVRDRAPDDSWQLVDHEIDFGWYAPRVKYVFRADLTPDRSIEFKQVSGDFKANEGLWEFEPDDTGRRTLLRYRAYVDPPGFIPNWLARSTFKREMPQMLTDLRKRCEAEQARNAAGSSSPH
jgi:ribosome-associated toxin RatA of RatAB toxin-antitoxin module